MDLGSFDPRLQKTQYFCKIEKNKQELHELALKILLSWNFVHAENIFGYITDWKEALEGFEETQKIHRKENFPISAMSSHG